MFSVLAVIPPKVGNETHISMLSFKTEEEARDAILRNFNLVDSIVISGKGHYQLYEVKQ